MSPLGGNTKLKRLGLVFIAVSGLSMLLLLIPSLWGDYARLLLFTILLYIIMALSYDVVGGLLGYLYLGHGLFFGLGAYTTALALKHKAGLEHSPGKGPAEAADCA